MFYPVAIEPGTSSTSFGVVVPDLPGCFSAGGTLEEALHEAETAIAAWIEATLDAGGEIPGPTAIEALRRQHKAWRGWVWALVRVDPALVDDSVERVNISLSRRILRRLDDLAQAAGETRSGFIARLALEHRPAAPVRHR
jgi:predicted RNase H-like HicB family nuclease